MKKIFVFLLGIMLVFGLAACGSTHSGSTTAPESTETSESTEVPEATVPETVSPSDEESKGLTEEKPEEIAEEPPEAERGKILVVYYSATGNTGDAAHYIADATGADVFELEPVNVYTDADLNYKNANSRVVREHENPEEQDIELVASTVENWDEYDTVFIGFPIWWHMAAWPVNGFVKANDFTGKTVIPFCTSGSSDMEESGVVLAEMAGTGEWLEGKRFESDVSENDVKSWIDALELDIASGSAVQISVTIGEVTLYADLYDNDLAREFVTMLPQTISMQRVGGGREFYGTLDGSLSYDVADSQTTFENGEIAYWYSGNGFCLLYDNQVEEPEVKSGIITFGKITSDYSILFGLEDRIEATVALVEEQ